MKRLIVIIGLLLLILSCEQDHLVNINDKSLSKCSGSRIYLSDQGSDDNPGTIDLPVRNLSKAIELADNCFDIYATTGIYKSCQANLKTSLFGGFNADFSQRDSSCETEIIGTGYWGDPLPVIQVVDESDLVIDGVTIRIGESANFRPCGILFKHCDSTVILQNCKIYGQLSGDAKGMSAVFIWEANPQIMNNYIYGGNVDIDHSPVNGIRCFYSESLIKNNVIDAGKNKGCLHGIFSCYSKCQIVGNIIYGGESNISCYSCAIRTGDGKETWNDSGSEDVIKDNELYGGIGSRTYAIICSQESELFVYDNVLDGGCGSIVSMGVYIKTNDKPHIIGNTFQNCCYGSYEWNIGDYAPGETSNAFCIRDNFYKSSVDVLAHWYDEVEYLEYNVCDLKHVVQTEEGCCLLGEWGNKEEVVVVIRKISEL